MREAQHAKVRRALRMAGVQPGDRVLEIGCGWGALAEMATTEFGASLTGVTLSTEQLAFARKRMAAARTGRHRRQADLRLQDYRDIDDGPYDAICSIEMVEAVGAPTGRPTSRPCTACSSPAVGLHPEHRDRRRLFERYIRSTDFIQQYIFPGGCLPCPREFRREAEAAGLRWWTSSPLAQDYAETLRRWRERLPGQREADPAAGFRRALHAHLGVLPRLLRSRLRHGQHRPGAVHAGQGRE
jgi:cyclopropane-fatty-acyl-phospholipid synthase